MIAQDVYSDEIFRILVGKTIRECIFGDTKDGPVWTFYFTDGSELTINEWYSIEYSDDEKFLKADK